MDISKMSSFKVKIRCWKTRGLEHGRVENDDDKNIKYCIFIISSRESSGSGKRLFIGTGSW